MSIETMLFDQDYVTEMYEHELIEQGNIEGKIDLLNNLIKQGLLTKEEAKKQLKNIKMQLEKVK